MKRLYIYDLETYPNFFLASFKCNTTNKYLEFEISYRKDDRKKLKKFLHQKGLKLVGFNNLNFDYPVLHNTVLKNNKKLSAYDIYVEVEKIINTEYSSIWDDQIKVPQLDLYKIWHYDNKNKSTSLKWLEFAMRMENVADLPYKPGTYLTDDQMDHIIEYCRNDLDATHEFFKLSEKHIHIRQFYSKKEGINLMNASETKIAKDVFGKYLSMDMGITYKELKKLKTPRYNVDIKDVIFDYIKFKDPSNIELYEKIRDSKWVDKSDMSKAEAKLHTISFTRNYKGIKRVCGEGGIHSFGKSGIFTSDDEYMIYDLDFASYYPHLSFVNKLHPAHIPEEIFSNKYKGFYIERKNYPKSDPRNYVLKIILNSSYGLSKDKHAFLYDPLWQLSIVINGQLLLMMLTEWVVEATTHCQILFENTDGVAVRIKRSEQHLVDDVCKRMEELSGIALEAQECHRMIMRDVNNYINEIEPGKIKFKGAFEIDRDFHKNHSKRIVPLALANYYINDVKPEDTILNHLSNDTHYSFGKVYGIYDFCIGSKMKGSNKLYRRSVKGVEVIDDELNKMNRYYISNNGDELIKKLPPLAKNYLTDTEQHNLKIGGGQLDIFDVIDDIKVEPSDRESNIESGSKCTLFNIYNNNLNYDINYDYYIKECYKIINNI
jgi:hypothetical protein